MAWLSDGSKRWCWLSAIVILVAGLLMYSPAFEAGFWTDDYTFVVQAARTSSMEGVSRAFAMQAETYWYRPLQIIQWLIEYQFFGKDPVGYHVVNTAIHLGNCLLLLGLVTWLTRRPWLGLVAALAFLVMPPIAVNVFWPGVADPLMTLFYLAALTLWLRYLADGGILNLLLACLAFAASLLTKEMGATLIVILFLADRFLISKPTTFKQLALRYLPLLAILVPYALIEYQVSNQGVYVGQSGYAVGGRMLGNLAQYLQWLAFPWNLDIPLVPILVGVALGSFVILTREPRILFLTLGGIITLLPVLPFPYTLSRYIYLPAIASAALASLGLEFLRTRSRRAFWRVGVIPGVFTLVFVWGSLALSDGASSYSNFARATRLQFSPIFRRHATFPPDTLLYFIQPPFPTPRIWEMMYLQYGDNVYAYGTDRSHIGGLRSHNAAFVYYYDEQNTLQEQVVDKGTSVRAAPGLPVQFSDAISLEEFELASANLKPGEAIAVVLYWRIAEKVDRDYTVFLHLVDTEGRMVTGVDEQPRQGTSPTSTWQPHLLWADGHVIPITREIPLGEYKIEIGLYDYATMQRLSILNERGTPATDKIVIEAIRVVE